MPAPAYSHRRAPSVTITRSPARSSLHDDKPHGVVRAASVRSMHDGLVGLARCRATANAPHGRRPWLRSPHVPASWLGQHEHVGAASRDMRHTFDVYLNSK